MSTRQSGVSVMANALVSHTPQHTHAHTILQQYWGYRTTGIIVQYRYLIVGCTR